LAAADESGVASSPQHFHSKNGKAYLFNQVVNVVCGPHEERLMTTGLHIVCDISCAICLHNVGWKYVGGRSAQAALRSAGCRPAALCPLRVPAVGGLLARSIWHRA
jgi:hypothetical protein